MSVTPEVRIVNGQVVLRFTPSKDYLEMDLHHADLLRKDLDRAVRELTKAR